MVRIAAKIACLVGLVALLSACSVVRASHQPPAKDLHVLHQGTHKNLVRAEFGPPVSTEQLSDQECDIYNFQMGSGTGAKLSRVLLYSLFDLATLGLTEIIFDPMEIALSNDQLTYKTCFNQKGLLIAADELRQK